MTAGKKRGLLSWAALVCVACSAPCCYKSIDLGVTAEEGLKYSIPGMRGDPQHYSPAQISDAEQGFHREDRLGRRWGDVGVSLLCGAVGCVGGGWWMSRRARRES